jgi:CheY-like chemotaxis protein
MKPVLVVDDDPALRRVVTTMLRRRGLQAVAVSSGEECLEQLRAGFRGLILMDIVMPGLTGWQTIRAAAEQGLLPGNVICMLTGQSIPNEEAEGLQEIVTDYLTKPFDAATLARVVDDALACLEN